MITKEQNNMKTYRGWWQLLDVMPEGWVFDKKNGSPLHGYSFVTNGKSPLKGQQRALLRVLPSAPAL